MTVMILSFIAILSTALCLLAVYHCQRLKLEKTVLQIKCLFYRLR